MKYKSIDETPQGVRELYNNSNEDVKRIVDSFLALNEKAQDDFMDIARNTLA